MDVYRYRDGKKLRCGYTTGTCAAAAAKAATGMLLSGEQWDRIRLVTPKGIALELPVWKTSREADCVSCAVQKDAGDDADVTNGIFIFARAQMAPSRLGQRNQGQGVCIDLQGGEGIGRVTRPGLDQPVGEWAINSGPRKQIREAVEEVAGQYGFCGTLCITLWIPQGRELAEKTFNPKLGIEGGISIIGTSGIVEPMSEEALLDTIRLEIHMKAVEGSRYLILTPGNYGQDFIVEHLKLSLEAAVKCSNFIGEAFRMAWEEGFGGILLIGHVGKLVKLGAGRLNTHSKYGDGRMEELELCMDLAGFPGQGHPLLDCVTTEDALQVLGELGWLEKTMDVLMRRIQGTLFAHYARQGYAGTPLVEVITFTKQQGLVGQTAGAGRLLEKCEL